MPFRHRACMAYMRSPRGYDWIRSGLSFQVSDEFSDDEFHDCARILQRLDESDARNHDRSNGLGCDDRRNFDIRKSQHRSSRAINCVCRFHPGVDPSGGGANLRRSINLRCKSSLQFVVDRRLGDGLANEVCLLAAARLLPTGHSLVRLREGLDLASAVSHPLQYYCAQRTEVTGGRCAASVDQLWPPSTDPNTSPDCAPK
jgi:hypothetical protein